MKKCTKCKVNERFSNYNSYCRSCKSENDLKSYHINKEKRKRYKKEYNEKNFEKIKNWPSSNPLRRKQYMDKWYNNEDNKNKAKVQQKEYNLRFKEEKKVNLKKRYNNEPQFRITVLLRGRLYQMLKTKNIQKSNSSLDMLGCSIEEFKLYLEQQFKPEMNWENHGVVWEIDHIKPCDSFNLEILKEQYECFNYKNLQPLFKTTEIAEQHGYQNEIGNRNKSNKY